MTDTLNPKDFAEALICEVQPLTLDANNLSRGEYTRWTWAVKEWLAKEALKHDCRAIYSKRDEMSEFMLDVVWWQNERPGSALLACESEWGNTRDIKRDAARVAEDFDKLLSFKAPFKLMIFEAERDSPNERETIAELDRYLREYADHRDNEQYLVINLCNKPAAWLCRIADYLPNERPHLTSLAITVLTSLAITVPGLA